MAEDTRFPPTETRAHSLWPETTRAGAASGFQPTRFDPAAEERARAEATAAAAFDLCHPSIALRAVLLVQAVLAVGALALASSLVDWGQRQAAHAFAGAAGTLVWIVVLCALRRPLARSAPAWRSGGAALLGAAAALLAWAPLAFLELSEPGPLRAAGVAATGAGLALLLWSWLELRARIWEPANAQARLAELQSRIRPHFLFNALNTALALLRADPERAERVLEDLSQLFRAALAEVGASVTLSEEIELAKAYLAIEQVRFGARLRVNWDIDPAAGAARVPALVLQPLVENAVRHGVEPSHEGARVWVDARARHGQAVVMVSNTVSDEPSAPGHGMALHNVQERLRLLHDVAAQLDTWRESTEDGNVFHARIVLPLG